MKRLCSIEGCTRPSRKRGWCQTHYSRWQRHGDPLVVLTTPSEDMDRFVDAACNGTAPTEPNGCILWPFPLDDYGYASRSTRKGRYAVGRVVLSRVIGPAPSAEHQMGHAPHEVCGNRSCIAPAHLSWQTPTEQAQVKRLDGHYRRKTHCPMGHEFTTENTYLAKDKNGERRHQICRTCHRLHAQRYRDEAKAARST